MTDRLSEQASSIGALAEPVRRALYAFVVAQREPVSREQAADGIDVPVHTAKFHLDKLVEEGLLAVEFRRLSGRTGPGAGRPSKLYHRSARELSVSLPERRYDVVGRILAGGVVRAGAEDVPVEAALAQVATEEGRRVAGAATAAGEDIERVGEVLRDQGYEPARRDDDLLLANCPFDALAREHTELVCGLNESFVHGVVEGLGCTGLVARLDPEDGLCCVKVRAEPPDSG
jgi:predicted ArsR family transcriptional regulator